MTSTPRRLFCLLLCGAMPCLFAPATTGAHEIPADVVVQTWVRPADGELTLLVRVPLEAMRDIVLPLRGPGYVDIAEADDALRDAATVWIANQLEVRADGRPLENPRLGAVRLSLPSDRSFGDYASALEHVTGKRLPPDTELYARQALLDVQLVYPLANADAKISLYPNFRRLGLNTTTVIRFLPPGGELRLFEFSNDPGLVHLDPGFFSAFTRFVDFGFEHILDGIDHLLFVLCLIIPFRRIRPLVVIVTSFTVAHSITLVGSAFGMVPSVPWFPSLIESLIALSIVYMALENIFGSRWERRWIVAFGFGLVHGFGFSFALTETLQFAGAQVLTSLLAFNLGVELGQLLIIVIAVPLMNLAFRLGLPERMGTIVLSGILAHSGWHWMTERIGEFLAWQPFASGMSGSTIAAWMRAAMLLLIVAFVGWLLYTLYRKVLSRTQQ